MTQNLFFGRYGGDAKLIHFLGALKPWQHRYDSNTGNVDTPAGYQHLAPYLNSWWAIYNRLVKPGVPDVVSARLPVAVASGNTSS